MPNPTAIVALFGRDLVSPTTRNACNGETYKVFINGYNANKMDITKPKAIPRTIL